MFYVLLYQQSAISRQSLMRVVLKSHDAASMIFVTKKLKVLLKKEKCWVGKSVKTHPLQALMQQASIASCKRACLLTSPLKS